MVYSFLSGNFEVFLLDTLSCIHRVMALVLRDTCRATSPAALIRQWRGRRATTTTRAATAALRRRGTRCCNGAIGSGCAVSRCAAATSRRLRRPPPRGPQPASDATVMQHRVLRNSEETGTMRSSAQQQNTVIHMMASPDRERPVRGGNNSNNGNLPASPDNKKGSSSGSEGSVWPKFAVALTNKQKEEDFLVFKGSRPPHRSKKRAKVIQKTINLVCPGTWLCDLTLERYEVREKVSKKCPRGLKTMQNMDSDSE